jgi:uncharacterized protein
MKYVILFAFAAFAWWIWTKRQASKGDDASARHHPAPEKMVACAHCGVHLPQSEGVTDGERIFCCEAHRLAAGSAER